MTDETKLTYRYEDIALDDVSNADLLDIIADPTQHPLRAYRVYIWRGDAPQTESAQALYSAAAGRLGIAWGADATWADVDDLESGIEMWLNDPDEWEDHN